MKRFACIVLLACLNASAWGAEAELQKIKPETDVQSLERGATVLMDVCHSCHSLKYLHYRDLLSNGMDKQKVDAWRADQPLDAAMMAQMPEDAAAASFGKAPPDLSLMVKAREGGADYVYSYLLGYYLKPDGALGNHFYPVTKMPDVLNAAGTQGADRAAIEKQAMDVVSFLSWAADPHAQERIRLGYYVIGYLVVLTILLYFLKKQIWARLK